MKMLNLSDYRRYLVAFAAKKNSEAMDQIGLIIHKCHLQHVNIGFIIHKPRHLALSQNRLRIYLDAEFPAIS